EALVCRGRQARATEHSARPDRGGGGGRQPRGLPRVAAGALRQRLDDRDRRRPAEAAHGRRARLRIVSESFPIVRRPASGRRAARGVGGPHSGPPPLPQPTPADYREPPFATFAYGFADAFASDVYGALHEHGATVLATPLSRMFVDVNRRRDDVESR